MADCRKFELDIVDYLDGTLSGPRLDALTAHLERCPACSHEVREMRKLLAETAALYSEVPAELHERIMSRVAGMQETGRQIRFPARRTFAAVAAVFVLVCSAMVGTAVLRRKGMSADSAASGNMLTAQNAAAYIALEEADEEPAESDEGFRYSAQESAAEPESAEVPMPDAEEAACDVPETEEDAALPETDRTDAAVFAALSREDLHFRVVTVVDAPSMPEALEALSDAAVLLDTDTAETVYCITVSPAELESLTDACAAKADRVTRYDAATPGTAPIDENVPDALLILRLPG